MRTPAAAVTLALAALTAAVVGAAQQPGSPDARAAGAARAAPIDAVTRPSADIELAPATGGIVAEVAVRDGARVAAGDLILRLDDRDARTQLELAQARAESSAAVDLARATWELAKAEEERSRIAAADAGAASFEVERQALETKRAYARLLIAQLEQEDAERRAELARLAVERYAVTSPITGTVERMLADVGEGVQALRPVARVVSVQPLHVEAAAPMDIAGGLSPGDAAWVRVPIAGDQRWRGARVLSIARVGDAGSQTRRVRLELDNPNGDLPAGARAQVRFDGPGE